jgi:hypothetical protein
VENAFNGDNIEVNNLEKGSIYYIAACVLPYCY